MMSIQEIFYYSGIGLFISGIIILFVARQPKKRRQVLYTNNRVLMSYSDTDFRPFRVHASKAEIVFNVNINSVFTDPRVYLTDVFPIVTRERDIDVIEGVKYCEYRKHGKHELKKSLREGDYVIVFKDISEAVFSLTASYEEYPLSRLYELGLVLLEIGATLFIASYIPQL